MKRYTFALRAFKERNRDPYWSAYNLLFYLSKGKLQRESGHLLGKRGLSQSLKSIKQEGREGGRRGSMYGDMDK